MDILIYTTTFELVRYFIFSRMDILLFSGVRTNHFQVCAEKCEIFVKSPQNELTTR